jgi:hypothetical protein
LPPKADITQRRWRDPKRTSADGVILAAAFSGQDSCAK